MVKRCIRRNYSTPPFEVVVYRYIASDPPPPEIAEEIMEQMEVARAYWNSVLTEPLPPVSINAENSRYGKIRVDITFIDIPNGPQGQNILARARPYEDFRRAGNLPLFGSIEIDEKDVGQLVADGQLTDVIKHELFHVFTNWRVRAFSGPLCQNSEHVGARAIAEYSALTGNAEPFIPMQPGDCFHWSENIFNVEINTPQYDSGAVNPNSRMSIAVLEDLGYNGVSYASAEPYVLGQSLTASPSTKGIKWRCSAQDGMCVITEIKE